MNIFLISAGFYLQVSADLKITGQVRGGCARRNNYLTCAIISILAHATQFNPLSQHLSIFVRFVSAVTLTCGILAAVRRFSAG